MNQLMDEITSNKNGLLFISSFFLFCRCISLYTHFALKLMVFCLLHHFFCLPLHLLDILNHFSVDSISMISNNVLRLCKSKKYV